jgi:hypothetical protein
MLRDGGGVAGEFIFADGSAFASNVKLDTDRAVKWIGRHKHLKRSLLALQGPAGPRDHRQYTPNQRGAGEKWVRVTKKRTPMFGKEWKNRTKFLDVQTLYDRAARERGVLPLNGRLYAFVAFFVDPILFEEFV